MTEPGPGHAYTHERGQPRTAQLRALSWALGVNVGLLVVEAVGGLVFHSLALLADAAHLVSDVVGLGIAVCGASTDGMAGQRTAQLRLGARRGFGSAGQCSSAAGRRRLDPSGEPGAGSSTPSPSTVPG